MRGLSRMGHSGVVQLEDYLVLSLRREVAGDILLEAVHVLLRAPWESPLLRIRKEEGCSPLEKVERIEGVEDGVARRDRMERGRWLELVKEDPSIIL